MYISKIKVGNTIYDIKAGENNVQANWTESDTTSDAYIQNKPTIITTADINELFGLVSTQGSAPTLINSNSLAAALEDYQPLISDLNSIRSGASAGATALQASLNSTTSLGTIGTTTDLQPVGVDSNGDLCVSVSGGASSYGDVTYSYATQSTSGAVSIDGTIPLHIITCTGNVTGVTLSSNPPAGHSCHVIFTATSARTVAIAHDATNRKCPGAANLSLSITANGYVEVDFLNANSVIYVRGV